MFFQLLFSHLFKPFLKYNQSTSPLPSNVSPRKLCTQAAATISKLLRLYKRSHGLRQICNIAVYIVHSACTIHLLNLPDKNARRDIIHGVKQLEEIAESWLCARRSLGILSLLARKWNVQLPSEAESVLARTEAKFGPYRRDAQSPGSDSISAGQTGMKYLYAPAQTMISPTQQQFGAFSHGVQGYFKHPFLASEQRSGMMPVSATYQAVDAATPLPPQTAAAMLPHQHPSASTTPASTHRYRSDESIPAATSSVSSPNGMFGGIDQLLQQSQDWVYKDQAQFGTGFGNWIGATDDAYGNWPAEPNPAQATMGQQSQIPGTKMSGVADLAFSGDRAVDTDAVLAAAAAITGNGDSLAMMQRRDVRFDGKRYGAAMSYDEDEWYQ